MKVKTKIVSIGLSLCALFCFALLPSVQTKETNAVEKTDIQKAVAQKTVEETTTEYEIYPVPQDIAYANGTTTLTEKVNLFFGDTIDDVTKEHTFDALSKADVLAYTDGKKQDATNVYVGVYGSGDKADKYAEKLSVQSGLFEKTDAYFLSVGQNAIVVLGKDTDAAYYGVTTLSAILTQTENRVVRNLAINDYSDCTYRGFIEGYYGMPWTTDERIELMEFGSQFKANIYIYAPKDDAYHSTNWRGLYSDADLAELKEEIEAGKETKTRFAWAIHPFLYSAMTADNYKETLPLVQAKFEQLYEAGVRQFVISADDISVPSGSGNSYFTSIGQLHRNLLNDMSDWVKAKGDCYDLIFVPSAYCYNAASAVHVALEPYFNGLMNGLDESVNIMWTGEKVCSSVSTGKFEEFTSLTDRKAFMWLNWPVNDYKPEYLLLGEGEVLDQKLPSDGQADFLGIVTNPLELAEASKLSIFAVADYCWNINGFDSAKSYADSFRYIESGATESLAVICNQMTNASLYEDRYFAESTDFADVSGFVSAYQAGEDVTARAAALIEKFNKVISACDDYTENAENLALKEEISPWVEALKELCTVAKGYLYIIENQATLSKAEISSLLKATDEAYVALENLQAPTLNKITYSVTYIVPRVSASVLTPFVQELSEAMFTDVTYSGFTSIYQGKLQNIVDGKDDTYVWFGSYPDEGAYVDIDLGEVKTVNQIRILTGNGEGNDVWTGAEIQYSADGETYVTVGTTGDSAETVLPLSSAVQARYIRLYQATSGYKLWVAVKEVTVS
jgi:hyaluronoglucosaminidase